MVGESGSGKSTVAKLMLQAERPDPGAEVIFKGADGKAGSVAKRGTKRELLAPDEAEDGARPLLMPTGGGGGILASVVRK